MTTVFRRFFPVLFLLVACGARAQDVAGRNDSAGAGDDHFAAASLAFEQQDYASARRGFQAALDQGNEAPAVLYNLAVSQYRLGEYADAEATFRALGSNYPELRSLADYNIGLTLVRLGQPDRARGWFENARLADDDRIASLAQEMLARLPVSAAAQASEWVRFADASFGHDDNVALIDPLALPAGQSTDSAFAEFQFYVSGPLLSTDHWGLTANAFLLRYPDASNYNQNLFDVAAYYERQFEQWQLVAGPRIGRVYLDGNGFEQSMGASIEMRRPLQVSGAVLKFGLNYDRSDEIDSEYDYIDGTRRQILVGVDRSFSGARLILDYRLITDDRAGAGVSADRTQLRSRLRRAFNANWTGELVLEYRDTDYDRLAVQRQEQRSRIGLLATRNLGSGKTLAARYWHSDNDASDPLYSYSRRRLSLGISWLF